MRQNPPAFWKKPAAFRTMQKRPMGLEIEAPTPDKYEKGAGRLEGGTA